MMKQGEAPMYHRIMEILVFLMDEFGGTNWQPEQMNQVSDDLIQRGYTEQEINTAFYWLYNRFGWDSSTATYTLDINDPTETSHRVLHTQEQRYISPEAFGYLLQLKHLKLITSKDVEEIIERVLILDLQLATVEEVKMIVQSILFEDSDPLTANFQSLESTKKGETYH